MTDHHDEGQGLTRASALSLAAAGAAGLVLGTRAARAAPSAGHAMGGAATAFLASLSDAQSARARFSFTDAERFRWHWTAPANRPRNGIPLKDLDDGQRVRALALLRTGTSARGYRTALAIMALEGVLPSVDPGNASHYDPDLYYLSVFGTPGNRAWGWRFEGHHFSRHVTVVGTTAIAEPFFLGSWPSRSAKAFRSVVPGFRALPREEDAGREVMGLAGQRLRRRILFSSSALTDHVTQFDPRVRPLDPVGVRLGDLPSAGQRRVQEIVSAYLANHPPAVARDARLRITRAGQGRIRFGWAGSIRPGEPHYYRLQGPTFLLEFDNSRNDGTHIHSVWRDFTRDFGRHLL
jgi:hypothetical protein